MASPEVVMVGVDGSETGRHALAWGVDEAVARGWGMLLVSAWSVPHVAGVDADLGHGVDDDAMQAGAEYTVEEARQQVAAHPRAPAVETLVRVGDAAGVLVEASTEAGLAVVGKRGRGGFASRLLGGVSIALPAHAACPTVVVPLPASDETEPSGDVPPGSVVVGVDGSTASDHAAHVAAEHARRWDVPLTLVCGIPVATPVLAWMPVALDPGPMAEESHRALAACAQRVGDEHPGVEVRHLLVQEPPPRALVAAAGGARLLVVGARGHGGFAGMLLGSVSQSVLAHARCPVLVVPRWCSQRAD